MTACVKMQGKRQNIPENSGEREEFAQWLEENAAVCYDIQRSMLFWTGICPAAGKDKNTAPLKTKEM